ncbi:MAG: TerC family protein [Luteolibacter sp.]|jgi:predicted tellurium resistance membrane protein TerC|nr:TerC family protein [Luteolibacter sp.]
MFDFSWFSDPNAWAALATLTLLEIVLGIDNIVFLSILVDRLPPEKRKTGRIFGLGLAMITRLMLLATITWIMGLKAVVFSIPIAPAFWKMVPEAAEHSGMLGITGKGIILLIGGFFLIWKATREIHHKLEDSGESQVTVKAAGFAAVLIQIAMIDIIFSLDSVITAAGMADHLSVMALAVIISVGIMMIAAGPISEFVSRHPSVKMLALSFLILIGTALIAEGLHFEIPKGYIYFAMAFSLGVELLNLRARARIQPPAASQI